MYSITVFVPEEHSEKVKEALFNAGAGKLGAYEKCAWECSGEGQFMPLEGSSPERGEWNRLEKVRETMIICFCSGEVLTDAIQSMKRAHPYETPAYFVHAHISVE